MGSEKIVIGKKGSELTGIVWAPYIPVISTTIIHGIETKNITRKKRINKVFKLDLIIEDGFSPSGSLSSRYSKKMVNSNFYGVIETKKQT